MPGVDELELVLASLTRHDTGGGGPGILDELRQQNFELLTTLATLREREQELTHLNAELGDTNRAVTALYAELEVQAGELRRRVEANASFLSSLTHELRTPLYAVRGMTEAILRDHEDDLSDGIRQDVTLIDGAMVEALELVNDHLDLAKLAAGRTIVRLSDVDVPELFATLRAVVTRLPAHPAVELHFDEAADLPLVRTDGFKLSQILRNFIVNALKFTERGSVRVGAAVAAGGGVRFEVADTGPGLSRRGPDARVRGVRPARRRAPRRAARHRPRPAAHAPARGDIGRSGRRALDARRGRRVLGRGPRPLPRGDRGRGRHRPRRLATGPQPPEGVAILGLRTVAGWCNWQHA